MKMMSGLKSLFKESSFNKLLKCCAPADAVGYSFIINLPLTLFFIFSTLPSKVSLGISCISWYFQLLNLAPDRGLCVTGGIKN